MTPAEMEAVLEGVKAVLSDVPVTRADLADAVAKATGLPKLSELLRSGWGALLKPSAFRGDLCFGPSQGRNVTFVNPRKWLGNWRAVSPDEAIQEVARRFLGVYGPATPEEFARWWGIVPAPAKRLFRSLGGEIEPVDVEGWKAWALASSIPTMRRAETPASVRLLPSFDPYTVAVARHSRFLLEDRHRARVYRPQAWISSVVLAGGRIVGVWESDKKKSPAVVDCQLFSELDSKFRPKLESETRRLTDYLRR